MSALDHTLPLVRSNLTLFRRDPGPLIGRVVQPVLLLLLLQPLYTLALHDPARAVTQLVLGHLVLFSLLSTSVVGTAILSERAWNTFDRLRATSARVPALLVGKSVPILLFIVTQQAVLLGVGIAVIGMPVASYGLLVMMSLVWAVTVFCIGAAIAMLVKSLAQLSAVVDIAAALLVGLGGGLVPISAMPAWVQAVASAWPTYWAMDGLRGAVTGRPESVFAACAVLSSLAALGAVIAGHRLAHGWGRSTLL